MAPRVKGLPVGWAMATLSDIAECRLGKMLDQQKNSGAMRPYLRNTNVQWGRFDLADIKEMRIEDRERDRYRVLPGDLLVCEGGEPGRCAVWRDDREIYLQKALHRVRPYGGVSPDYVAWWLRAAAGNGSLDHLFTGSTIKHLPGRQLARTTIPLPPTAEQHRIASLLAEIDRTQKGALSHLRRAKQLVAEFRSAVLGAACAGHLSADWRNSFVSDKAADNAQGPVPGPQGSILGPRASSWDAGGLWDIPDEWVWTSPADLQEAGRALTYGVIKLGQAVPDGVPTLRSSDVRWLQIDDRRVKRIGRDVADQYERTYLRGGEVVVTVRGSLGGVAVVPRAMKGWNVSREVAVLPLARDVSPEFVALMIGSPQCQRWMASVARGVAYTGVNIKDLKRLPLPLPSRDEQAEIVRRVQSALSTAAVLDDRISTAISAAEGAAAASLRKAFAGELVVNEVTLAESEGRDCESARVLLDRIQGASRRLKLSAVGSGPGTSNARG